MNILKGLLVVLTLVVPNTLYAENMGTTKGSANYQTGIALSKTMASQGVRLIPIPHSGTAIYMTKVNIGKVDFGISGSYVLDWGYRGTTIFDKPHENLRFVANLQHFKTAIVVRNNSDIILEIIVCLVKCVLYILIFISSITLAISSFGDVEKEDRALK